jgi:hypothetical protein
MLEMEAVPQNFIDWCEYFFYIRIVLPVESSGFRPRSQCILASVIHSFFPVL